MSLSVSDFARLALQASAKGIENMPSGEDSTVHLGNDGKFTVRQWKTYGTRGHEFNESNRATRDALYKALTSQLGDLNNLPDAVKDALKIKDFGLRNGEVTSDRPLTLRRIVAIEKAVSAHLAAKVVPSSANAYAAKLEPCLGLSLNQVAERLHNRIGREPEGSVIRKAIKGNPGTVMTAVVDHLLLVKDLLDTHVGISGTREDWLETLDQVIDVMVTGGMQDEVSFSRLGMAMEAIESINDAGSGNDVDIWLLNKGDETGAGLTPQSMLKAFRASAQDLADCFPKDDSNPVPHARYMQMRQCGIPTEFAREIAFPRDPKHVKASIQSMTARPKLVGDDLFKTWMERGFGFDDQVIDSRTAVGAIANDISRASKEYGRRVQCGKQGEMKNWTPKSDGVSSETALNLAAAKELATTVKAFLEEKGASREQITITLQALSQNSLAFIGGFDPALAAGAFKIDMSDDGKVLLTFTSDEIKEPDPNGGSWTTNAHVTYAIGPDGSNQMSDFEYTKDFLEKEP